MSETPTPSQLPSSRPVAVITGAAQGIGHRAGIPWWSTVVGLPTPAGTPSASESVNRLAVAVKMSPTKPVFLISSEKNGISGRHLRRDPCSFCLPELTKQHWASRATFWKSVLRGSWRCETIDSRRIRPAWRSARAAESTSLLMRGLWKRGPRVQIPPSPPVGSSEPVGIPVWKPAGLR